MQEMLGVYLFANDCFDEKINNINIHLIRNR